MRGSGKVTRRDFIRVTGAGIFLTGMQCVLPLPAWARSPRTKGGALPPAQDRYDLVMDYSPIYIDGREGTATAINGSVPGPLVHLREGDDVLLTVTNKMENTEHSSIHWHGILVPFRMDGVPGVNFNGIKRI